MGKHAFAGVVEKVLKCKCVSFSKIVYYKLNLKTNILAATKRLFTSVTDEEVEKQVYKVLHNATDKNKMSLGISNSSKSGIYFIDSITSNFLSL